MSDSALVYGTILPKWSAKKIAVHNDPAPVAFPCKSGGGGVGMGGVSGSVSDGMKKVMNNAMRHQAATDLVVHMMSSDADTSFDYWVANWTMGFLKLCDVYGFLVDTNDLAAEVPKFTTLYEQDPYALCNVVTGIIAERYEDTAMDEGADSLVAAWMASPMFDDARPGHSIEYTNWAEVLNQALDRHLRDTLWAVDRDTFVEYVTTQPDETTAFEDMIEHNGLRNILEIIYWAHPDSFIMDYYGAMPDSLPYALAKSGVNLGKLINIHDLEDEVKNTIYQEVLVGQHFNLEEQHIYGSKRLGIQTNPAYPGQWWWHAQTGYVAPMNIAVNPRIPWYSLDFNDLMHPNLKAPRWDSTDYSQWMSARVIGTKYYELTNHLGDVQATILDRLTPNLIGNGPGNEDTVKDYRNDVRTATDYYPFGMIMPERFFEALPDEMDPPPIGGGGIGTGQMKVAQPDSSQLPDNFVPQVGLQVGNWSGLHPNININRLEWMGVGNGLKVHVDSLVYMDDLRDYYAGVDGLIQTLPDTNYDVVLQTDNNNAGYLQAVAYNWSGGTMNILGSVGLPTSGTYTLNFTADLDTTHICIVTGVDTTVDFTVLIASMAKFVTQTVNVPNIVVAVPSKYRFGFNGQEKVDEVAGVGNHLYFGAREYDPRDIRWWHRDPLFIKYPSSSPYSFVEDNPIIGIDPNGDDWVLSRGDKVYWYGGNAGDRSNLLTTYKASSGKYDMTWDLKIDHDYRNSKFQNLRDKGPTPEGKYEINLKPDPARVAVRDKTIPRGDVRHGQLLRSPEGGIEQVPLYEGYPSYGWGNIRAKLDPIKVTGAKPGDRDNDSYYFHDSQKGGTSGCTEVPTDFFKRLIDYRNAGNGKIEIWIDYPSNNHSTYGGTDKTDVPSQTNSSTPSSTPSTPSTSPGTSTPSQQTQPHGNIGTER